MENKMSGDFAGKVALVTGGGGGIGRGTALAFAKAGAKVAIADIAEAGGNKTMEMIGQAGGTAMFIKTDVTDAKAVEAVVKKTVETWGRLDCAFNNAGIEEEHMRLADCPEPVFDRIIGINVKGVWLCMKYELAHMLKQGGGSIVNTASIAGLGGAAKMAAYSASKHAVIGLTKSAAIEYARKNIRVNAVCPAVIRTEMYERALATDPSIGPRVLDMHPIGRIGEVEEVAAAVLWLSSPAASFITGFPLAVDGGTTAL
jgi:NAD(P)-dependent dehydrogenase (short-subunit alcohol dehydrogenase family)